MDDVAKRAELRDMARRLESFFKYVDLCETRVSVSPLRDMPGKLREMAANKKERATA